jgi:hypothetical protein
MSTARPSLVWSRTARLAAWVALLPLAACSVSEPQSVDDTRAGSVTYVRSYSVDPYRGDVAVSPTGEITYVGFVRAYGPQQSVVTFRTRQDGSPAWTRTLTVPVDPIPHLGADAIVDAVPDALSGEIHVLVQFDPEQGTVVAQLDRQGQVLRRRPYGSLGPLGRTEGQAIVARPGGGFVVAGHFNSETNGFGLWMLEVGRDGTVLRERRTRATEHSLGTGDFRTEYLRISKGVEALTAVDGGYLVSGSRGNLPWLAKVDTTLAVTWERRMSTSHGAINHGRVNRALRLPASSLSPATYITVIEEHDSRPGSVRERMTRFDWRDGSTLWDENWWHGSSTIGRYGAVTAVMEDAVVDRQGRLVTVGIGKACNPACDGEGSPAALLRVFRPQATELVRSHQIDLGVDLAALSRESLHPNPHITTNAAGDYFVLSRFSESSWRLLRLARGTFDEPPAAQTTTLDLQLHPSCGEVRSLQSLPGDRLLVATRGCIVLTDEQGAIDWMLPASQSVPHDHLGADLPLIAALSDGGTLVALGYFKPGARVSTIVTRRAPDGRELWTRSFPRILSIAAIDRGANPSEHALLALLDAPDGILRVDLNDGRPIGFLARAGRLSPERLIASGGDAVWVTWARLDGAGNTVDGGCVRYDRLGADGEVTHSYSMSGECAVSLLPDGTRASVTWAPGNEWSVQRTSPVTGQHVWTLSLGAPIDSIGMEYFRIIALPDGGAAVAAVVSYPPSEGGKDILLARFDRTGQPVFARRFGTAGTEVPLGLTAMPDGGFLITGSSTGFELGRQTLLAIRTDADGRVGTDCTAMAAREVNLRIGAGVSLSRPVALSELAGELSGQSVDAPRLPMAGEPAENLLSARACIAPSLAPVLRVSAIGNGVVSSVPGGIACGPNSAGSCAQAFATGTSVRLEALASAPDVFIGWLGHCSEAASAPAATVILDQSATCEARFAPPDAVPSVAFADAEFDDGAWSVADVRVQPSQPVGATWRQVIDAGNPGKYREMHDQVTSGVIAMSALHINMGAVYEPALQGAVTSLHYSEDRALLSAPAGAAVQSQALLEQGGRIFTAPLGSASTFSHADWRNASATLHAADFQQLSGPACAPGQACPDFSAVGAPMRFGYMRGSRPAPGSPPFEQRHGIDNWQVTVHRRP